MAAPDLASPAMGSVYAAKPEASMQWLQVLPHLDPIYGGLTAVVPRLARQLAHEQIDARIAAFCSPDETDAASAQDVPGLSLWPLSRSPWLRDSDLKARFHAAIAANSGVHIHGLWESSTLVAASAARKASIPYVISAHGMLERWALANKRLKKSVYAALFERRNVRGAACMHALTRAEAGDYRRFGCGGPIAVIPNGVEANPEADPAQFLREFPQAQGKRLVLFLGRIHFKKGVDLLVNAWAEV
ncbi:MAG: glycosyltransferase, partial [Janthinobacterium lividum]